MTDGLDGWLSCRYAHLSFQTTGYFTDVEGLPIQLPCRPGTFLAPNAADKTTCITCAVGTFNEDFTQRRLLLLKWRRDSWWL
jgi:hypothetical protein